MNEQQRLMLGVGLCILFWFGYTKYLENRYPDFNKSKSAQVAGSEEAGGPTGSPENSKAQMGSIGQALSGGVAQEGSGSGQVKAAIRSWSKEKSTSTLEKVIFQFNPNRGGISSIQLRDYPAETQKNEAQSSAQYKELIDDVLKLHPFIQSNSDEEIAFKNFSAAKRSGAGVVYGATVDAWKSTVEIQPNQAGYAADINVSFTNNSPQSRPLVAGLRVQEAVRRMPKAGGLLFSSAMYDAKYWQALVHEQGNDYDREDFAKECNPKKAKTARSEIATESQAEVQLAGFDSRYFVKLVRPVSGKTDLRMERSYTPTEKNCVLSAILKNDLGNVSSGQTVVVKYKGYFGPKDDGVVASVDPVMNSAVQMGWFAFLAKPLLKILRMFHSFLGNWGFAIILLTVLLKLLFFPLTRQAAVSAHHMKKLQPEMKRIQELHKDDRQKMQSEMMQLYRTHKINPAQGCLPILPTIPVFLAFWQMQMYAIDLRQAPFIGWIKDLSQADPYYIAPVLLGVLMLVQMRMMPNASADPMQKNIMMIMPLVFTFAMISLPAGLVVYMIANTLITVTQQHYIQRKLAAAGS